MLALPGCDVEAATVVAERVRSSVPRGQTCTIGVAPWRPGLTARAMVDLADAALYEGKANGRDVVVVHSDAAGMSSDASVAPSAVSV